MISTIPRLATVIVFFTVFSIAETSDAPFQVRYVANLNVADAIINITNTGMNGAMLFGPGIGATAGNICVNVYAFSADEQMVACCSCHVTPNALVSLSAYNDIRPLSLTGLMPNSMVIKLVAAATGPGPSYSGGVSSCSNSAAGLDVTHPVSPGGMAAWTTTAHVPGVYAVPAAPAPFDITETPFTPARLSAAEIATLRNRCGFILANGSSFGICRSCSVGGRGAVSR